jgi:hypothetical protein
MLQIEIILTTLAYILVRLDRIVVFLQAPYIFDLLPCIISRLHIKWR